MAIAGNWSSKERTETRKAKNRGQSRR